MSGWGGRVSVSGSLKYVRQPKLGLYLLGTLYLWAENNLLYVFFSHFKLFLFFSLQLLELVHVIWTVLNVFFLTSYLHKLLQWDQYQPIDSSPTISAQLPLLSNATKRKFWWTYSKIYTFACFIFHYCLCELTAVHGLQSKGRKILGNDVGYQHTKCSLRKAKWNSRKKFKLLAMYAFTHSNQRPALIVSMDLVVWFFYVIASFSLNLDKSNWDLSIQFCFSVLSWPVGSGMQNAIWKKVLF